VGVEVGDIFKVYDNGEFRNNCWVTKIKSTWGGGDAFDIVELNYQSYSLKNKQMDVHTLKLKKHELHTFIKRGDLVKHTDKIKPIKAFNKFSFINKI
jgi:hypothetical protein